MCTLPRFTYFDDPVKAQSFVQSEDACMCCGQARGWMYDGVIHGEHPEEPRVCPWCISDGTMHERWPDACFNDPGAALPQTALDELEYRTPKFATWQHLQWPCCCDDACVFRGYAQYDQLTQVWPEALEALRLAFEADLSGSEPFEEFLEMFKNECDPGAYAFQCRHCNKWQVPWDIS